MNEIIEHKSWLSKNRIWLYPLILLIVAGTILFSNSKLGKSTGDIAKAYADVELCESAIKMAQTNADVTTFLGALEPLDKLAIIEGTVIYGENDKSVALHCRVKGSKGKGKIDIYAERNKDVWDYKKIDIRLKEPKQTIEVIKN